MRNSRRQATLGKRIKVISTVKLLFSELVDLFIGL